MDPDAGRGLIDEADRPASGQAKPQLPVGGAGEVRIFDEASAGAKCLGPHGNGAHGHERLARQPPEHVTLGVVEVALADHAI